MTERGRGQVERDARTLRIGPSGLRWEGDSLVIEIDEVTMPVPQRVRGTVRVMAPQRYAHVALLSARGQHRWQPIAPGARVEVELRQPGLRWSGAAYLDSNRGDAPLEDAFERWDWSRAHLPGDRAAVFYDVERREGGPLHVALAFDAQGRVQDAERPARVELPASRWGVPRGTRCDADSAPRVLQTLTDAPFYARSLVETTWSGEPVTAMHESLSMPRFTAPWVQALLPFRMPRRGR